MYLHYTGPGSGGGPPRYMELLKQLSCTVKSTLLQLSILSAKWSLGGCIFSASHAFVSFTEIPRCTCIVISQKLLLLPALMETPK